MSITAASIPTYAKRDLRWLASILSDGLVFAAAQTWTGLKTFASGISVTGPIFGAVTDTTTTAGAYSVLATDQIVNVAYTTTGAVTVTLPTAQAVAGRTILIKDVDGNANTNNITVATEGAETIDSGVLTVDYGSIEVYSDGTNWFRK
jgi:hypothetical protein